MLLSCQWVAEPGSKDLWLHLGLIFVVLVSVMLIMWHVQYSIVLRSFGYIRREWISGCWR